MRMRRWMLRKEPTLHTNARDGALKTTEEPGERPEVGGIARKPTSNSTVTERRGMDLAEASRRYL